MDKLRHGELPAEPKLHQALSPLMKNLLSQSEGKRNDGWLQDSSRLCKNFESNLIAAWFAQEVWDNFKTENPQTAEFIPNKVEHIIFALHKVPLYIYDSDTSQKIPFAVNGISQTAPTILFKSYVGYPIGIITEGELAGLVVEPFPHTIGVKADEIKGVTVSRLMYLPVNTDPAYDINIFPDDIDQSGLQRETMDDFQKSHDAFQQVEDFVLNGSAAQMKEMFANAKVDKSTYIAMLGLVCDKLGITLDLKNFNYFE